MESIAIVAYLILAGLAIVHSLLLSLQTWEHRRYVRSCMRELWRHRPSGHAAVFVPCKGLDTSLEGNLRAILCQDYHDYEVTFIVESADDPACEVIRRLIAAHPSVASRLMIAGEASQSGQKVHNLHAATARLSLQVQYLAFLDSDARPRPEWLRTLVRNLCKPNVGAVTGYRWFVPTRRSIANHLLYGINCDVMSLMGRNSPYIVWGGSWGIRREVFDSIGLHDRWKGTLSDDLTASRLLRRAGCKVRFVPACVVASPLDYSLRQMLTFIRRQYMVGRVYVPRWWAFGVAATTFTSLAWLGNVAVLGWAVLGCSPVYGTPLVWMPACVCALLYLFSIHRGLVRQGLVRTYFPDRQSALRRAGRLDVWANPVVGLVNWVGVLGSLFGRHITWRGIRYRVWSDGQVRAVWREGQPATLPVVDEKDHARQSAPARKIMPYRKAG